LALRAHEGDAGGDECRDHAPVPLPDVYGVLDTLQRQEGAIGCDGARDSPACPKREPEEERKKKSEEEESGAGEAK